MTGSFGIWIPGQPVPAVRPRVTRWSTYYPGAYGKWLPWASEFVQEEWGFGHLDGALTARLIFLVDRPKSHMGQGRNAGTVRPAMRVKYPFPGGDLDNYVKGPLDALNGVAFHDDKQVTDLSATKRWTGPGESAGVLISLDQFPR